MMTDIKCQLKEILIEACTQTTDISSLSTCVVMALDETQPLLYTANIGGLGSVSFREKFKT